MATKVIMPKQGLQMTEGTITQWLVKEGGKAVKDEPLFEMETDKLTITMPAPESGTLIKIVQPEGAVVPITETIAYIGEAGEKAPEEGAAPAAASAPAAAAPAPVQPAAQQAAQPEGAQYDVAVIGGGPGGYIAAIRAAQYGNKVVLVEKRDMGGTCLNRGCIPTKALLHSAELFEDLQHAAKIGVLADNIRADYKKMAENKDSIVARLRRGVEGLVKGHKAEIIKGEGTLTGASSFKVDGKEYTAKNIILATGSVPASIPVKGAEGKGVLNSDDVLSMDSAPGSVAIIGGGVIGIEFASLYNALGKKVAVIEMLPTILAGQDEEVCTLMTKLLKKRGIDIYTSAKLMEIKNGSTCVFEKDGQRSEVKADCVIMAVGRKPETTNLGLEAVGVKTEKGFVIVDDHMRTNIPGVYAIGDLTGKIQLAHVASAQGLVAAANASGKDQAMHYNAIPSCIYSTPEIASVGLTEKAAREKGYTVKIGSYAAAGNGRSMIMGQTDGFAKLVTDEKTGEILGAHIVAVRATDMIGEIGVAMNAEATIEEVADTVHAHPTVHEMIMEAAHDVEGLCCHKL